MAAKLKEFSIFNVSIEFGFMNSKIIDQHFCRDALSISRHVGRRVFFVAAWNIFWRAQHLKLMEWLKISVSFWGHDPTYLRALLHHRCLRFVHVINQFCQLLFCFTLFVKSSRFNVQNRDIIILMAMIVTIRWFSCLGAWFWTQRKDHQGRNYYLRWDCPLNTWWVYNKP